VVRIICGTVGKHKGPVKDVVIDPEYLDVTVPVGVEFIHDTKRGHTVLAYVIGGTGYFDKEKSAGSRTAAFASTRTATGA